jgi:hypothetical protein
MNGSPVGEHVSKIRRFRRRRRCQQQLIALGVPLNSKRVVLALECIVALETALVSGKRC